MDRSDRGSITQVYANLLGLPPAGRMIAGALAVPAGVFVTIDLWEMGFISGLALFFAVGGLFLFISGWVDHHKQKRCVQAQSDFLSRKSEIVSSLVAAKREGRNSFRILNQLGVLDPELRQHFLSQADEQLKRQDFRR